MKTDFQSPTFKLQLTFHRLNIYKFPEVRIYLAFKSHQEHIQEHINCLKYLNASK